MGEWQPIETAPKDGTRVDLYAKCWRSQVDDFMHRRFTDCSWSKGDSMVNRKAEWFGVDNGWFPTPLDASP